jgi:Mitochondrial carrier protein
MTTSRLDQTRRELVRNMVAAASTTMVVVSLLNPLDVLRIKWQTRPSTHQGSLLAFARLETQNGGGVYRALYRPGLGVNAASVGCSSGFRLGIYPVTKELVSKLFAMDEMKETKPQIMFLSGFISGSIGFFLATPLFTAKIRAQKYGSEESGFRALVNMVKSGRPFAGSSILVARGAFFSAGFSFGYDGTKTHWRSMGNTEGPVLHAFASIIAAFVATGMAAPFDAILTRYQSHRTLTNKMTPLSCIMDMFAEAGPKVFFRGWTLFFARVAPLFIVQLPMYEQTRRLLGMDFMR